MSKQQQVKKPRKPRTELVRAGNALVRPGERGFQTYFNDEIAGKIVTSIREGLPITMAGYLQRVPQSTVSTWLAHGEDNPDGQYGAFAAEVRQAQAEFVREQIANIRRAGASVQQWTAAMTLLERLHPEYFQRPESKSQVNVNVAVGIVDKRLHELHEAGELVYDGS